MNCKSCKYFYNSKCINKDTNSNLSNINIVDEIQYTIEQGYSSDGIKDNLNINTIKELLLSQLLENGFVKKAKIKELDTIDIDSIENELIEVMDNVIHNTIIPATAKAQVKQYITIKDPDSFYCSNYI